MDRRGLWIALFVSLALNLFIVGGLVGAHLSGMRLRPAPPGPPPRPPIVAAIRSLPPERQQAWRDANRQSRQTFAPRMREARQLSRQAMRRFGEEPFPRDAILTDLTQARALELEGRSAMDQRLVDFAATLSPAERARFGEALARPPRPLGRRGPGGEGRRPGLPDG
jgi:uncharacterized membrane protein